MQKEIKKKIENYNSEFEFSEVGMPLIMIVELLSDINNHLENISNKMYE